MGPYSYQNGGDWCWFGGRMIRQLVRHGLMEEAYRELTPMTNRVLRHNGFYEWWSRDNQPHGSGQYRGSAGVLGIAIVELLAWARQHQDAPAEDAGNPDQPSSGRSARPDGDNRGVRAGPGRLCAIQEMTRCSSSAVRTRRTTGPTFTPARWTAGRALDRTRSSFSSG